MSKFSKPETWYEQYIRRHDAALNYEGGAVYRWDARSTLAMMSACSLVNEESLYGDTTGRIDSIAREVATRWPEWFVKLAVFLREELRLRSISQKTAAIAAVTPECRPYLKDALDRIIVRPDDLIEMAALLKDDRHGLSKGTPHIFRQYAADRLNRFDNWECMKYRKGAQFGMRQMLKLYHPKPAGDRQRALFNYLINPKRWAQMSDADHDLLPEIAAVEKFKTTDVQDVETLRSLIRQGRIPWEMVLPHAGASKEIWNALGWQMPIMALIRNLRNLCDSGALADPALRRHITDDMLRNEAVIMSSRQLPFRWYSAWNAIRGRDSEIENALVDAMNISVKNLPRLDGTTVIACDNSGSMTCNAISSESTIDPIDIASLLGAIAAKMCERHLVLAFAEGVAQVNVAGENSIFANMEKIKTAPVGHTTNAYKILRTMIDNEIAADRLLVLTDMEIYDDSYCSDPHRDFRYLLRLYRQRINPGIETYVVNLQPYEYFMLPQNEDNVTVISGWNHEILRYIKYTGFTKGGSLVEQIDSIKLN